MPHHQTFHVLGSSIAFVPARPFASVQEVVNSPRTKLQSCFVLCYLIAISVPLPPFLISSDLSRPCIISRSFLSQALFLHDKTRVRLDMSCVLRVSSFSFSDIISLTLMFPLSLSVVRPFFCYFHVYTCFSFQFSFVRVVSSIFFFWLITGTKRRWDATVVSWRIAVWMMRV